MTVNLLIINYYITDPMTVIFLPSYVHCYESIIV